MQTDKILSINYNLTSLDSLYASQLGQTLRVDLISFETGNFVKICFFKRSCESFLSSEVHGRYSGALNRLNLQWYFLPDSLHHEPLKAKPNCS